MVDVIVTREKVDVFKVQDCCQELYPLPMIAITFTLTPDTNLTVPLHLFYMFFASLPLYMYKAYLITHYIE